MKAFALTTIDNPYSPFTQFPEWYRYDEEHGYHTCSYLARVASTSPSLFESEENEEIERAIDDIVTNNPLQIYVKLESNGPEDDKKIEEIVKLQAQEYEKGANANNKKA